MLRVLRHWYERYFSEDEVVYLVVVLFLGFSVVALFGRILAPVFTALIFVYMLHGLERWLVERGMQGKVAVWVVYSFFISLLSALLFVVLPLVWRQLSSVIQDQLPMMLENTETLLLLLPKEYPRLVTVEQIQLLMSSAGAELGLLGQSVLSFSLASLPNLMAVVIFLVLMPMLVFFFLKDKEIITQWFLSFLPAKRELMTRVWIEMDQQISNYIRGKAIEILIVAAVTNVVFLFLGLNYAVLLALLVGLSVIVPYIGAVLVTVPVAVVGYLQFGVSADFVWLMVLYSFVQFLDGNILVPVLFSEAVNLHPVAIIVSILVFGGLWGLWGVFFAIPLATLIKALLSVWPKGKDLVDQG